MVWVILILCVLGLFVEYPVAMTVITVIISVLLGVLAWSAAENTKDQVSVIGGVLALCIMGIGFGALVSSVDDDSVSSESSYSTSYTSSSSRGTCIKAGCNRTKASGSSYCYSHKNSSGSSSSSSSSSSSHGSSSSYNSHSSSSSSASNHHYNNDPADYDSPEDYADDAWGDDFDDWDDAYDYWENY